MCVDPQSKAEPRHNCSAFFLFTGPVGITSRPAGEPRSHCNLLGDTVQNENTGSVVQKRPGISWWRDSSRHEGPWKLNPG